MVTNVLALAGLMAISAILKRIFRNAPRETRLEKYNADYAVCHTPLLPLTASYSPCTAERPRAKIS